MYKKATVASHAGIPPRGQKRPLPAPPLYPSRAARGWEVQLILCWIIWNTSRRWITVVLILLLPVKEVSWDNSKNTSEGEPLPLYSLLSWSPAFPGEILVSSLFHPCCHWARAHLQVKGPGICAVIAASPSKKSHTTTCPQGLKGFFCHHIFKACGWPKICLPCSVSQKNHISLSCTCFHREVKHLNNSNIENKTNKGNGPSVCCNEWSENQKWPSRCH